MLSSAFLLYSVSLAALQVSASVVAPLSASFNRLLTRQSGFDPSVIPAQCQSQCSATVNMINSCSSTTAAVTCGCSTKDEQDFLTCMNCFVSLAPTASVIQTVQDSVDGYIAACKDVGVSLPPATVSGAGTSGGGSGTRSGSAPAAPSRTTGASAPDPSGGSSSGTGGSSSGGTNGGNGAGSGSSSGGSADPFGIGTSGAVRATAGGQMVGLLCAVIGATFMFL